MSDQVARAERRAKVAAGLRAGLSYRQIAEGLGCSHGTVGNDAEAIRRDWAERAAMDFDAVIAEEISKLDELEVAVREKAFGATGDGPDARFCDLALAVAARRARLLGLDRPLKAEIKHDTSDVEAMRGPRGGERSCVARAYQELVQICGN